MSRMFGFFFVICDAVMTVATFLNSTGFLLIAAVSIFTSMVLAATSSALRSMLWPTYFWDQPDWDHPDQVRFVPPATEAVTLRDRSPMDFSG